MPAKQPSEPLPAPPPTPNAGQASVLAPTSGRSGAVTQAGPITRTGRQASTQETTPLLKHPRRIIGSRPSARCTLPRSTSRCSGGPTDAQKLGRLAPKGIRDVEDGQVALRPLPLSLQQLTTADTDRLAQLSTNRPSRSTTSLLAALADLATGHSFGMTALAP